MTGLHSRAAFSLAIGQVDADRDNAAVLVLGVTHVVELNQTCGWDAGDDLLNRIGDTLSLHASVDVTAARLAGNRFGLLRTPVDNPGFDLATWADPIVRSVQRTIDDWCQTMLDFDRMPMAPLRVRAGTACATGGQAWADAELALDIAGRSGSALTIHHPDNEQVAAALRTRRINDELSFAVANDRLVPAIQTLEALTSATSDAAEGLNSRWHRIDASAPVAVRALEGPELGRFPVGDTVVPGSELARALDRWMLATATGVFEHEDVGRTTLVVPLRGVRCDAEAVDSLTANVETLPFHPSNLTFEVDCRVLQGLAERSLLGRFNDLLADRGLTLLLDAATGGWAEWHLVEQLPIVAVKPTAELARAANSGDGPAGRVLAALEANAHDAGLLLVASSDWGGDGRLTELGFDLVERPATPRPGAP